MSGTRSNDIIGLVESLTPHQRLALLQLLTESMGSFHRAQASPAAERSHRLTEALLPLSELVESLQGAVEPSGEDSNIRPFSIRYLQPGHALVRLSAKILSWPQIWDEPAHAWVSGAVLSVTIDTSRLPELNSSTIAWMVTLAQKLPGGHLTLKGLNPSMTRALKVLRLEQVLIGAD